MKNFFILRLEKSALVSLLLFFFHSFLFFFSSFLFQLEVGVNAIPIVVQYSIQYNVLERDDDKLNETLQAITVREMGNVLKTDIGAIFETFEIFLLFFYSLFLSVYLSMSNFFFAERWEIFTHTSEPLMIRKFCFFCRHMNRFNGIPATKINKNGLFVLFFLSYSAYIHDSHALSFYSFPSSLFLPSSSLLQLI